MKYKFVLLFAISLLIAGCSIDIDDLSTVVSDMSEEQLRAIGQSLSPEQLERIIAILDTINVDLTPIDEPGDTTTPNEPIGGTPTHPVPGGQDPVPGGQDPVPGGQDPVPGGQDPVPGGQDPTPGPSLGQPPVVNPGEAPDSNPGAPPLVGDNLFLENMPPMVGPIRVGSNDLSNENIVAEGYTWHYISSGKLSVNNNNVWFIDHAKGISGAVLNEFELDDLTDFRFVTNNTQFTYNEGSVAFVDENYPVEDRHYVFLNADFTTSGFWLTNFNSHSDEEVKWYYISGSVSFDDVWFITVDGSDDDNSDEQPREHTNTDWIVGKSFWLESITIAQNAELYYDPNNMSFSTFAGNEVILNGVYLDGQFIRSVKITNPEVWFFTRGQALVNNVVEKVLGNSVIPDGSNSRIIIQDQITVDVRSGVSLFIPEEVETEVIWIIDSVTPDTTALSAGSFFLNNFTGNLYTLEQNQGQWSLVSNLLAPNWVMDKSNQNLVKSIWLNKAENAIYHQVDGEWALLTQLGSRATISEVSSSVAPVGNVRFSTNPAATSQSLTGTVLQMTDSGWQQKASLVCLNRFFNDQNMNWNNDEKTSGINLLDNSFYFKSGHNGWYYDTSVSKWTWLQENSHRFTDSVSCNIQTAFRFVSCRNTEYAQGWQFYDLESRSWQWIDEDKRGHGAVSVCDEPVDGHLAFYAANNNNVMGICGDSGAVRAPKCAYDDFHAGFSVKVVAHPHEGFEFKSWEHGCHEGRGATINDNECIITSDGTSWVNIGATFVESTSEPPVEQTPPPTTSNNPQWLFGTTLPNIDSSMETGSYFLDTNSGRLYQLERITTGNSFSRTTQTQWLELGTILGTNWDLRIPNRAATKIRPNAESDIIFTNSGIYRGGETSTNNLISSFEGVSWSVGESNPPTSSLSEGHVHIRPVSGGGIFRLTSGSWTKVADPLVCERSFYDDSNFNWWHNNGVIGGTSNLDNRFYFKSGNQGWHFDTQKHMWVWLLERSQSFSDVNSCNLQSAFRVVACRGASEIDGKWQYLDTSVTPNTWRWVSTDLREQVGVAVCDRPVRGLLTVHVGGQRVINCGESDSGQFNDCYAQIQPGQTVTVRAQGLHDLTRFEKWAKHCSSSTSSVCTFVMPSHTVSIGAELSLN